MASVAVEPDTSDRPAWLGSYVLLQGILTSSPLDMPSRMNQVYANLATMGWRVAVKSIGTDFSGPLGVPVPKDQPIELYLLRIAGGTTPENAAQALATALDAVNLTYNPIGAWIVEFGKNVVAPTVQQASSTFSSIAWMALAGLILWKLPRK